jgi:hypothetical protein
MMSPERWVANLIEAAVDIANREHQELRWLAPDAQAWERPEELICVLFDDCDFERFVDKFLPSFSEDQRRAAFTLRDNLNRYCDETPKWLDPAEVLGDPRWGTIREDAAAFVEAFRGRWQVGINHPEGDSTFR